MKKASRLSFDQVIRVLEDRGEHGHSPSNLIESFLHRDGKYHEQMGELFNYAQPLLNRALEKLGRAKEKAEDVQIEVRRNPWKYVAISAAAGLVFGMFYKRR